MCIDGRVVVCLPQREQDGYAKIDLPLVGPGVESRLPRAVGAVTLQRVKRPRVEIVRDVNRMRHFVDALSLSRMRWLVSIFSVTLAMTAMIAAAAPTPLQLRTADVRVYLRHAGPLRIGMRLLDVRRVLNDPGASLAQAAPPPPGMPRDPDESACSYLNTPKLPDGMKLMFVGGQLARIDVRTPGIRTASGAAVGSPKCKCSIFTVTG